MNRANTIKFSPHSSNERVLVTGGAGFIGSHLVDALLRIGSRVRILDNLEPQVHGGLREQKAIPSYLDTQAEFVLGDVREPIIVTRALQDIDVVFHLAALVGIGQSTYEIARYIEFPPWRCDFSTYTALARF